MRRVFTSFHHANDDGYRQVFELNLGRVNGAFLPGGVQAGDIDTTLQTETIRRKIRDLYLRDTEVTVVLVGLETWKRKHVDWEIGSSLRQSRLSSRSGLLGIMLPSYLNEGYDPGSIPPRLLDNIECGYASLHSWSYDSDEVKRWIEDAWLRSLTIQPDNSRPQFKYNR